jgi:hypothetical protein
MKRTIIFSVCLLLGLGLMAQQSAVDKVFDKYSGKDGYTTVYISSFMFNMMSSIDSDDPDYEQFQKATKGINSLRILTQESGDSEDFGRELLDLLPREEYKEMMKVKDGDEEVLFLAREEGNRVIEFLLIVSGGSDDVLIAITGDLDMESIASIASGMDMPGMKNLEDLEDMP